MLGILREASGRLTDAARWLLTILLGVSLIVLGVVMWFTPGPGWGAIILGLLVLSREFAWARRTLDRAIAKLEKERHRLPDFVGRMLDERARRRGAGVTGPGEPDAGA